MKQLEEVNTRNPKKDLEKEHANAVDIKIANAKDAIIKLVNIDAKNVEKKNAFVNNTNPKKVKR